MVVVSYCSEVVEVVGTVEVVEVAASVGGVEAAETAVAAETVETVGVGVSGTAAAVEFEGAVVFERAEADAFAAVAAELVDLIEFVGTVLWIYFAVTND